MAQQKEVYRVPAVSDWTALVNQVNAQLQRIAERLDSIEARLDALEG